MVGAFDVYNLVQYEVAKVANELLELVILVWVSFQFFLFFPLQENMFRFSISYHVRSFYTTGEEVQTYA